MANGWGSRLLCLLWQKHPDRSVPPPCHWRERWWRHSSASCWSGWRCTSAMRALVCACTVVQCQLILSLLLFPLMPRRGTWVGAVMLPVFVAVIRWWFPHSWTAACERMCPGKLRWAASGLRKAVCWSNSNCASKYAARLETSFIFFPALVTSQVGCICFTYSLCFHIHGEWATIQMLIDFNVLWCKVHI